MDSRYVFLSYSHDNKVIADIVEAALISAGVSCWIDHTGIRAAENYNSAIDRAIEDCSVFLALLSKSYVDKYYCEHEFNLAIDTQKCIMSVCIDDVSKTSDRQKSYMFSFCAGHDILRYGTGVSGVEEDIAAFCNSIVDSLPIQQLLSVGNSEGSAVPSSYPSDFLLAHLQIYNEKQYQQSGNYALNELCAVLFPAIKDVDWDLRYKDEGEESVSLIKYLASAQMDKKHIFLIGEGGMGKTVSLLKTCEHLLNLKKCAIYVPLSLINSELTFEKYLREYVCGGKAWVYQHLCMLTANGPQEEANVVFLLDGVNEISDVDYVNNLFKVDIKKKYIDAGQSVQFIVSSRFDTRSYYGLTESFNILSLQPLSEHTIVRYLELCGVSSLIDPKVLAILKTPLLLTLYANVERHWKKYEKFEGISLFKNPDTPGKILSNFFQTQLFRAAEEPNFSLADHLVLLEFLLPAIAYDMVSNGQFFIDEDEIWKHIDQIDDDSTRFRWYRADRLRKILRGRSRFDSDRMLDLAENALHFLHRVDGQYEFLHQTFRDYFAAFFISSEMISFQRKPERIMDVTPIIQSRLFNIDILGFISDITREEAAAPCFTVHGWDFPGKDSSKASIYSVAEQLLSFWRGEDGTYAQNAVYNLLNVMRIGRKQNLAWCDFSKLDLRSCHLNGCKFSEWFNENVYPCIFDHSLINRDFFITDGHEAAVTAVCADGNGNVYSGDKAGVVKVLNIAKRQWINSMQLHNSPIVHMAWNNRQESIAILYEQILFIYSVREEQISHSFGNDSRNKKFRYVAYDNQDRLMVSYDLEPLIWYYTDGTKISDSLEYDIPAKCAQRNPVREEIVRSNLLQILSVEVLNQSIQTWEQHPALLTKRDRLNIERRKEGNKPLQKVYLSLRDFGISNTGSVNCICYHPAGDRFLVAIDSTVLEFNSENLGLIQKKTFTGKVRCVCYADNQILAGVSSHVVVMELDMTEDFTMPGTQAKQISAVVNDPDGKGYYIVSNDGEIKLINQALTVRRIRNCKNKKRFAWVRDRKTNEVQMIFLPSPAFPLGSRYSYDRDEQIPLGWCYEFLDAQLDDYEDQRIYRFDTSIMAISTQAPYKKIDFRNYSGFWIFGCSFLGVQGDLLEWKNQQLLRQNGGIVNGG